MNFVQRFLISTLISFLFSINVYATTWYVNDTSTVGDSFTSAAGYDTQSGMTADSPMRTISSVMPLMSPGDTVYVDAGTYGETVVIDTNLITLQGVDAADMLLMLPRYLTPGLYDVIYDIGRGGADGMINEEDFFELGSRYGQ